MCEYYNAFEGDPCDKIEARLKEREFGEVLEMSVVNTTSEQSVVEQRRHLAGAAVFEEEDIWVGATA